MRRRLFWFGLSYCALLLLSSLALAEDLPQRKPGLWELKIARNGTGLPYITMHHATTDKEGIIHLNHRATRFYGAGDATDFSRLATGVDFTASTQSPK